MTPEHHETGHHETGHQPGEQRLGALLASVEHRLHMAMRDATAGAGLHRRAWRILHILAAQPRSEAELLAELAPHGEDGRRRAARHHRQHHHPAKHDHRWHHEHHPHDRPLPSPRGGAGEDTASRRADRLRRRIDRLRELGLIEERGAGRLALSEAGRAAHDALAAEVAAVRHRAAEGLAAEEWTTMIAALERIAANLRTAEPAEPAQR